MLFNSNARAGKARALIGAAMLGSLLGLVIGGAYLAGGLARASLGAPRAERLAYVASQGYSDTALAATGGDPNILALADRHKSDLETAADIGLPTSAAKAPEAPLKLARAGLPHNEAGVVKAKAANPHRDLDCLTQAVYYEARGEGEAGQAAVAQVILNRVRHPAFPKSVCAVVFQGVRGVGCQFSFACDGSIRRIAENAAWRRAREIAEQALHGAVMAQVGTATHFHAARVGDAGWGDRLLKVAQVGAHIFYKFAGRNDAAAPAPTDTHPVFASLSLASLLPTPQPVKAEPAATTPVASVAEALAPTPAAAAPAAQAPAVVAKAVVAAPASDNKPAVTPAS